MACAECWEPAGVASTSGDTSTVACANCDKAASAMERDDLAPIPVCEPMHPDEDGWSEWIHPLPGYLMQCCDCGLIHEMEFNITEPHPGMGDGERNPGEGDAGVVIFRARRFPAQAGVTRMGQDSEAGLVAEGDSTRSAEADAPNLSRQNISDVLIEALELAANRLARCSVEFETGSLQFIEYGEWAQEARDALRQAKRGEG